MLDITVPTLLNPTHSAEAGASLADIEREHILTTLKACNWRIRGVGGTAEILDVKPSTLEAKMKKLGLSRPRPHPLNWVQPKLPEVDESERY